jgi:hypothetical protein
MGRLASSKGRLLAFAVVLVAAVIAVYAAGAITNNSPTAPTSSSSSPPPEDVKTAEETSGRASFLGHASNAVMFIQWTRSGSNVTGSLTEAIAKRDSLSLESDERAFTGVIDARGITLNLHGAFGESAAYVGEVRERGFKLTVPGQGSSLISVSFEPAGVSEYDEATKQLLLSRYPSPCSLYLAGHEVRIAFTGTNSAEDCASFVQHSSGNTEWTPIPQEGALNESVVCEVENRANEKATITDGGAQEYGKEACTQLSGEGWG